MKVPKKARFTQQYLDDGNVREVVFLNLTHDVVEMVIMNDGTRVLTKDTYTSLMALADHENLTMGDLREVCAWIYGVSKEQYMKMGQPRLPLNGTYNPEARRH